MRAASPQVVFLHPVALDSHAADWLSIPGLIAPTLLAHGEREPRTGFSLDDMADEITGWTSEPVHLIGCSMGGMVALRFALRHPERVASLVLGYTAARIPHNGMIERAETTEREGNAAMAEPTMARWFTPEALGAESSAAPLAYARARLNTTPTEVIGAAWRAIAGHDILDRLGELAGIPTTCIAGRNDQSTPLSAMEAIAAGIPDARLIVTDHPHMGFLEDPDGFSALVVEHLVHARSTA